MKLLSGVIAASISATTIFLTPSVSPSTSTTKPTDAGTTTITITPTSGSTSSADPSFTRLAIPGNPCPPARPNKRCRFLPTAPLWPAGGKECYCIANNSSTFSLLPLQPARPSWDKSDFERQGIQVKLIPQPTQLELRADGTYDTEVGSQWWMWVDQDEDGREDAWRADVEGR